MLLGVQSDIDHTPATPAPLETPPARLDRHGKPLPRTAWAKGGPSPNPKGRTPRSYSFTQALHARVEERRDEILARLVDDAAAGKGEALRILMERLTPANRATYQAVPIPGLAEATTLAERVAAVQSAMAAGTISADHCGAILSGLKDAELALQVASLREELERLRTELTVEVEA